MNAADRPNVENLARLVKLVDLAEELGLYLDVTGLGCYHKADVPRWYDADLAALKAYSEQADDVKGALIAAWLRRFRSMSPHK